MWQALSCDMGQEVSLPLTFYGVGIYKSLNYQQAFPRTWEAAMDRNLIGPLDRETFTFDSKLKKRIFHPWYLNALCYYSFCLLHVSKFQSSIDHRNMILPLCHYLSFNISHLGFITRFSSVFICKAIKGVFFSWLCPSLQNNNINSSFKCFE
jgi:hypothetical protein